MRAIIGLLIVLLASCAENHKKEKQNFTAIQMQHIPSGSFMMGDTNDVSNGISPVFVRLGYNFSISTYEITQAQWFAIMGANPSSFQGDSLPVENITLEQAISFCNKLSEREGIPPVYKQDPSTGEFLWNSNSVGYRLPTEAEWEYTAKGGVSNSSVVIPDDKFKCINDSQMEEIAWYCANSESKTHPIGKKKANIFGVYDMAGNVAEWVHPWGNHQGDTVVNPDRFATLRRTKLAVRGGSWLSNAFESRPAGRTKISEALSLASATRSTNYIGFRVVRDVP